MNIEQIAALANEVRVAQEAGTPLDAGQIDRVHRVGEYLTLAPIAAAFGAELSPREAQPQTGELNGS